MSKRWTAEEEQQLVHCWNLYGKKYLRYPELLPDGRTKDACSKKLHKLLLPAVEEEIVVELPKKSWFARLKDWFRCRF